MYPAHINGEDIQTCREHSFNTANYSMKNAESVGLSNTGFLCGIIHDAGKYTDEFEEYIKKATQGESVRKGSVIHTFAGVRMMLENYHSEFNHKIELNPYENLTAEMVSIAVGSHHGLFDVFNSDLDSGFDHRMKKQPSYDKKAITNFYKECYGATDIDNLFKKSTDEIKSIFAKISGLIDKTDNELKQEEILFYLGLAERFLLSCLIDGDRRDTAEFMSGKKIEFLHEKRTEPEKIWNEAYDSLIRDINGFPMKTKIQIARRELSDYCEKFADKPCGIYRLNLPTGAGKTLSSLRYAVTHAKKYNKKRIIFAIPLLSILDQNADVIRKAIGNDEFILEHHSNVVTEGKSSDELEKREFLIETWDKPIIITTLVQLLNTMFEGKTSCVRRFHCLADSVVVIDEVQSVPTKMLSLFNLTLNFLSGVCNTTFLLCSATQPLLELNNHKLLVNDGNAVPTDKIENYKEIFKRTSTQYIGELDRDEVLQKVEEYFQKYGSVLLVCNTKKEAFEFFDKAKLISDNIIHLSTSMCMAHRKEAIKRMCSLLNDKEPLICISTQLIEAGVDVSFGSVIRVAAGIDNIAQSAGRANRNGEMDMLAPVGITYLKNENLSKLKEIKLAQDVTGELIAEYKRNPHAFQDDLISEKSIDYYYESLFCKLNKEKGSTEFSKEGYNLMKLLSSNVGFVPENAKTFTMRQAFKMAGDLFEVFDNDQISVIVPYGEGENIISDILTEGFLLDTTRAKMVLKKADGYSVNLFDYQAKKLSENGALYTDKNKTVFIVNPDYYDAQLGVIFEKGDVNEWNTLIL